MASNKIAWLKEYRTRTGCGLPEALDAWKRSPEGATDRVAEALAILEVAIRRARELLEPNG